MINTCTIPVTVRSVTAAGDFAQTNNCQTLVAGANCTIEVTFSPISTGVRNGTITVVDDVGTHTVVLSGTGSSHEVSLNPSNIAFGSQRIGTTSTVQSVSISNTGTLPVVISSVTADGDFTQTNICKTLAAGANCTIEVTFSPITTGVRNGTITVVDDVGTQTVVLSGTGGCVKTFV